MIKVDRCTCGQHAFFSLHNGESPLRLLQEKTLNLKLLAIKMKGQMI